MKKTSEEIEKENKKLRSALSDAHSAIKLAIRAYNDLVRCHNSQDALETEVRITFQKISETLNENKGL